MKIYNVSEKFNKEISSYKVVCKNCSHVIVITPKKNKELCYICGKYVYRNEKEKFKDLMKGKLKNED